MRQSEASAVKGRDRRGEGRGEGGCEEGGGGVGGGEEGVDGEGRGSGWEGGGGKGAGNWGGCRAEAEGEDEG